MPPAPQMHFLLTATVRPNTTTKLSVTDPDVRLRQYQRALRHWAGTAVRLGAHLTVVETSGADRDSVLADVPADDRPSVGFVDYDPPTDVIARGIGFIEWSAVRHALDRMPVTDADTVYKITGRLVVTNPGRVFDVLPPDGVRLRTLIDGSYSNTRVVGGSVWAWRTVLLPAADDVDYDRRIEIEHTVAAAVRRARTLRAVRVLPFPRRPLFLGQSGTNGSRYSPRKTAVQGWLVRPLEPLVALAARSISR